VQSDRWVREEEPIHRTLRRNLAIAVTAGVAVAVAGRAAFLVLPWTLLALWPSLGGHFVEIAFLDAVRQRLPRVRLVQASARLVWWLAGGTLLGAALIATAHVLPIAAPRWRWWWMGGPTFIGIELVAHSALVLRRRPNFYRGDG
jgi:hypothetical protein